VRFFLFPTVQAPAEARRRLAPMEEHLHPASFLDLKTVIGELVTLSVAHGAIEPIDLAITFVNGEVECVVYDHGPGTRAIVRARERKDSSLVLKIIDGIVNDWGVNPGQTRIWFRMSVKRKSPGTM
jgi:hypothetical protein